MKRKKGIGAHRPPSHRRKPLRLTAETLASWFAIDRARVLRKLDRMRIAARRNADEVEMIATEGIFEPTLSEKIVALAKQYLALLRQLITLRAEISHTTAYPPDVDPAN